MADITVNADVATSLSARGIRAGPVWLDESVGYAFFVDAAGDFHFSKTADKGATWGVKVLIKTGTVLSYCVWFDKWTPGDSGGIIHMWYIDEATDIVHYRNLDTSDDSLGTERDLDTGLNAAIGLNNAIVTGCKSRGGNLYSMSWAGLGEDTFNRSVNDGVTWTARGSGADGIFPDHVLLLPDGLSADDEDMVMVYWDLSANQLTIKKYDDSGNSWAETEIATSMFDASPLYMNMSAVIRHSDGHILLAAWSQLDNAAADLRFWDITPTVPTITEKTNVLTNANECAQVAVFLDQTTDKITVYYCGKGDASETWLTAITVNRKVSLDGGGSWGVEAAYSEAVAAGINAVWAGHSTPGDAPGRAQPLFWEVAAADLFANLTNSEEISPTPPSPPGRSGRHLPPGWGGPAPPPRGTGGPGAPSGAPPGTAPGYGKTHPQVRARQIADAICVDAEVDPQRHQSLALSLAQILHCLQGRPPPRAPQSADRSLELIFLELGVARPRKVTIAQELDVIALNLP